MSSALSFLGVALVFGLCGLVGHGLAGFWATPSDTRPYRLAVALILGLVTLYLGEWLLYGIGLAWSRGSLLTLLALAAAGSHWLGRRRPPPPAPRLRWGWGDAVALVALAACAFAALRLWSLNPDFVYHWGIKGAKLELAGGFDPGFLGQSWDRLRHPEYPLLYPGQLAALALVGGGFDERALMAPSMICFALLLAAARQVLADRGASRPVAQATMALLGLATSTFGVGYLMAGSPDWFLALSPLAAWPLLARRESGFGTALALGGVAALAAGSKMEGLVLAGLLVAVLGLTRSGASGVDRLRAAALAIAPALLPVFLVVLPWGWFNHHHGIGSSVARGALSLDHLGTVFSTLGEALRLPEWHGFAVFILALPLLLVPQTTRWISLVCLGQLAFYLVVYLSLPFDLPEQVAYFIRSNAGRLAFHVVPTVLVACGVALARWLPARVSAYDVPTSSD